MTPPPPPADDPLAGASVFRRPPPRAWLTSLVGHLAVGGLIALLGTWLGVRAGVIPRLSVVEFTAPPPRTRPVAPPSPAHPAPPSPAAAPRVRAAARSNPGPARGGHSVGAPHVMAVAGNGAGGGDSMAVGDNADYQGGPVGPRGDGPAPTLPAPPAPPGPTVSRRPAAVEVPDEDLSVRATVSCDDAALARLYPQEAVDNEIEVPVLPMELVVGSDGALVRATARTDPGFGIAAAMERGALAHCRVTAVARDGEGQPVRSRVLKRIRFEFE